MPTRTTVVVRSGTTTIRQISGGSPSNVYPACLGGAWGSTTSLSRFSLTNSVTTGGPVKDYSGKIARGQSATSNLEGDKSMLHWSPFRYEDYWEGWPCWRRQAFGVPNIQVAAAPVFAGPASQAAEDAARRALTSDYISQIQRFNGGAAIAEFSETLGLLRAPLRGLFGSTMSFFRSVKRFRNISRQSARNYSKHLARAWLTYRFAAEPLARDVYEFYTALKEMSEAANNIDTVSVRGEGNAVVATEQRGVSGALLSEMTVHSRSEYSVKYKGKIIGRPPGVGNLMEWFGVDVWDAIPSVWEAIPASFIVDYFSNAGDMINGLRMCAIEVGWLLRGTKAVNVKFSGGIRAKPNSQPYVVTCGGGSFYSQRARVTRADWTGFGFPYQRLHFRLPGFGSLQWLNLGALGRLIAESSPHGRRNLLDLFGGDPTD